MRANMHSTLSKRKRSTLSLSKGKAFTLVELLVVVVIILVLLSIVMPSLTRVGEIAREVQCSASKMRQVVLAFRTFANDHQLHIPGMYKDDWVGAEEWKWSWMGIEAWSAGNMPVANWPYLGTIVPYLALDVSSINDSTQFYRCPSLEQGVWNTGKGSNGLFDYVAALAFSGAKVNLLPDSATALPKYGLGSIPTPIVAHEDMAYYLNYVNIEPGHSNVDRMGSWHLDGAIIYAAMDGSVQRHIPLPTGGTNGYDDDLDGSIDEADESTLRLGPFTTEWSVETPSGATASLTAFFPGWGGWNNR